MPLSLLLQQDIIVAFGVTPLLSGAELAVAAGDRICLVGRNGSGKSTLLRIAAGLVQPDAGERPCDQPAARRERRCSPCPKIRMAQYGHKIYGRFETLMAVDGDPASIDFHRERYLFGSAPVGATSIP